MFWRTAHNSNGTVNIASRSHYDWVWVLRISNIKIGNGIWINQVIQQIATTRAFWNLSRFSYNDKKYVVVLPCIYIHFQLYHIVILKTYNCRQDDQNTVYMLVVFHLNLIFVYTMYFDLSTPNWIDWSWANLIPMQCCSGYN